jgi:hypothetical protein
VQESPEPIVTQLVSDLQPVTPLTLSKGLCYAFASAAASAVAVVAAFGIREDLKAGYLDPVPMLAAGLFLVLGLASSVTVITMSRPQVGSNHEGWTWTAAMVALLPFSALATARGKGEGLLNDESIARGLECLLIGGGASVLVLAMLVWWLRKGAPTSPVRAGLLSGVAAGSLGIFAFSLHCADNDIAHIGLWHTGVVALMAAIGRMIVPPLVRW